MRIIVRPRWRMPQLDLSVPYVVISITDPGSGPANIPQQWGLLDVLRLSFHDLDVEDDRDGENPLREIPTDIMQPEHGRAIWTFLAKWSHQAQAIVVHCEAAASRSPSVAMAIADTLGWPRSSIEWSWDTRVAPPNFRVYHIVRSTAPAKP